MSRLRPAFRFGMRRSTSATVPPNKPEELRTAAYRVILSRKRILIASAFVMILAYTLLFGLPRNVRFSYAHESCRSELTLAPKLSHVSGTNNFSLVYQKPITIGGVSVASTQTCFIPANAPDSGKAILYSSPLNGPLFRSQYHISIGERPQIQAPKDVMQVAATKQFRLRIDKTDTIFSYALASANGTQACISEQTDIICKIDKLGLAQGATHTLRLQRLFRGVPLGQPREIQLSILPAVQLTQTSIASGTIAYDHPQSITFSLDKPLTSATAKLESIQGANATRITTQTKITGSTVVLSWTDNLPREMQFRATLIQAEATDGSTLAASAIVPFSTSGGPKVRGINIGNAVVASDMRVVVSFDQPIASNVDVTKFASISGGSAIITRSGSQIIYSLQSLPRCAAFTLHVSKGLTGQNGVVSNADWSFNSRINCRLTKTIGTSVNGRPIVAYFYGTGSTTILFNGGIHGTEPSGVYLMQDWAAHLDANAYKIPADKQVVIIPNDNPDAIAANQRYNAHNVNIDRNFPTSDWVADTPVANNQMCIGCGGAAPSSEPETQALISITSALNPALVLSYHATGSLVGANDYGNSRDLATLYATAIGYQTMLGNAEEIMGYTFSGQYETWISEQLGKPAILIELPTATGRYFSRHQAIMWQMVGL